LSGCGAHGKSQRTIKRDRYKATRIRDVEKLDVFLGVGNIIFFSLTSTVERGGYVFACEGGLVICCFSFARPCNQKIFEAVGVARAQTRTSQRVPLSSDKSLGGSSVMPWCFRHVFFPQSALVLSHCLLLEFPSLTLTHRKKVPNSILSNETLIG
jgi:hypothetical protein